MKKTTFAIILLGLLSLPNICMAAVANQSFAPVDYSLQTGTSELPQDVSAKIKVHLKQEMSKFEKDPDGSISSSTMDGNLNLSADKYDTRFKSGESWFALSLSSVGRDEVMQKTTKPSLALDGTKLNLIRQDMTEWYINHGDSLEHGLVLNEKPAGAGPLNFLFSTSGNLSPEQKGSDIYFMGEKSVRYSEIKGWDAAGKDLACSMSVSDGNLVWAVDDSSATYPITIDPTITYIKKITASDTGAGETQTDAYFGYSVDIYKETVVVGAYKQTVSTKTNAGAAYIFYKDQGGTNNWGFVKKITASDVPGESVDSGLQFSEILAISGDTLALVSKYTNVSGAISAGAAYIFSRNQGGDDTWGFAQKITQTPTNNGHFANSIAVCGDVLLIGYKSQTVSGLVYAGRAYLYIPNSAVPNTWQLSKSLEATDNVMGSQFSTGIAVSGDLIASSAPGKSEGGQTAAGAVYIFSRNTGGDENWGLVKKIIATDEEGVFAGQVRANYGSSMDISGDLLIVGSPNYDVGSDESVGRAYIYSKDKGGADQWGAVKILVAQKDDGSDYSYADAYFGKHVSISGDMALLSSKFGAYLYSKSQSDVGEWGIVKAFSDADTEPNSAMSSDVAIYGDYSVIGASDKTEDSLTNAGAAYIFNTPNTNSSAWCTDKTIIATQVQPSGTTVQISSVTKRVETTEEIKAEHETPGMDSMLGANVYEFTATVTSNQVAYFSFNSSSLGERAAGDVSLFKLFPDKASISFTYSSGKNPDDEGYFWITDEANSEQYIDPATTLVGARTYTVNYSVKDNGEYDLNSTLGVITDPVVPGTVSTSSSSSSSDDSGCVLNPQASFSIELIGLFIAALIGVCLRRKVA
ncbi:FG-GAP repeat protein [Maridesulfovibrio frigidus]|uniref:FG-GAP repeat protein n=1 Tax=Maridesulfovibrio frigidus TaxID=340956 RepID=UPI0004E194E8|nr:FG-GAP repeat protein [Maridesulfovibrio frigidus]